MKPVTEWEIIFWEGSHRYCNREEKLLSTGFGTLAGLKRNADIIRLDKSTLKIMRERYTRCFGGAR